MSAFKGTPGPWTTDEREHDAPNQNIRVRSGWRGICEVWIDDAPVPDYNAEQRANARLIAAAPELLSCLEMTAHGLEVASRVVGGELGAVFSDRAMSARDAIAKATGGAA